MIIQVAQLVIDNEIARTVKKIVGGIPVTDESMAMDVIKQVGAAGEFVSHEHTYRNFRKEQSFSTLFDRSMRDRWVASGGKDLTERAYDEARYLISTHQPLSAEAAAKTRSIVNEAEEHYRVESSVK